MKEEKEEADGLKKEDKKDGDKCEEYLNGWKRERADFLNYKKEEMERIGELVKYANEEMILKMLPILDNLFIAENKISDGLKKDEGVKGILQIKKQILDFLKTQGIEEIQAMGQKFDPNFHEVVEEIEGSDPGTITEEINKGYFLNGKVIRAAKIKIIK